MSNNKLNIVDDNDQIIGEETRERIHAEGLLHREVHVWFLTPDGELILQHRAKDKETYPDLLDATVGGHVEIGESYEEAAIKETREETGVDIKIENLYPVRKVKTQTKDPVTERTNHAFKVQFAYLYKEKISDLKIEEGKALGFEVWTLEKLLGLKDQEKNIFVPGFIEKEFLTLLQKTLAELIKENK